MRNGKRSNIITIEQRTQTGTTDLNEPVFTWSAWRETIFAAVLPRRGNERFDDGSGQRYAQAYFRFECAYDDVDGADETMRILFEGQYYDIRNIMPDFQHREACVIEATLQRGQS